MQPQKSAVVKKKSLKSKDFDFDAKGPRVKKQHTSGLGNIEEGRNAEKMQPRKKRNRKRPMLGSSYRNVN